MFMKLLRHKIWDLGPEERLFMASFAMRYGEAEVVRLTVGELAARMGMPTRVVMRATSKLSVTEEYLVVKRVSVGKGRPSRSYEVSPSIRARLSDGAEVDCPSVCMLIIKHLLSLHPESRTDQDGEDCPSKVIGFKQPPTRHKNNQLSLGNRWLLAVLASYANELGVVRGLGVSKLMQLTGMGKDRLKSQLLRLVELGLMRNYVPGVSSAIFTETKVSTTYFLNLNHPFLGSRSDGCMVIAFRASRGSRCEVVDNAAPLVVSAFLEKLRPAVFDLLCLRLSEYVAHMLGQHWHELGRPSCSELERMLLDKISVDFKRPVDTTDGLNVSDEGWSVVLSHFCWLVLERAQSLRNRLEYWVTCESSVSKVELIPTPNQEGSDQATTILLQHAPLSSVRCLVIWDEWQGFCVPYKGEADMPIEMRRLFGLQNDPSPERRELRFF